MKKKKMNWFMKTLIVLFIVFVGLFIAGKSGYYESRVSRNVSLTNDAIKQFEEDILHGKEVDLTSYVESDKNDYSNSFTRAGDKASEAMGKFLSGGLTDVWEIFKVLFT